MERGYIKLFRCVADNDLWLNKPFDKARAWIDLLLLANHKASVLYKRGVKIEVPRGAVAWSERQLSERWGWSRSKTRLFLEHLKIVHQIRQQNEPQNINLTSLIYITNYDEYQSEEPQKEPQKRPQKDHKKTTKDTMDNNVNNEKNIKEYSASSDAQKFISSKGKILTGKRLETFEMFWDAFSYKKSKAAAADSWINIPVLTDAIVSEIIKAAKAEAKRRPSLIENGTTPKMAQGWLTERRWEDEYQPVKEAWEV